MKKDEPLIEVNWGEPVSLVVSPDGDIQKFSTIEQARYWLRKKWPVADDARHSALRKIDAAMACIGSVGSARRAFLSAANSAGFASENLMTNRAA